jgi:2-dehydropantoate 2-reductase
MNKRKIGIIGGGAVGSILAVHLGKAGHEVYVVDIREVLVRAINEIGISVSGVMHIESRVKKALTSIDQLQGLDLSHIFICTKAYVLPQILGDLSKLHNEKTAFICFQNGLDLLDLLEPCLGSTCSFRGVVNFAGSIVKPGYVDATFFHPPNFIGCCDGACEETVGKAKEIAAFLADSGLATEYTPDIKQKTWQKTILNSALMLTSVLTRLRMNEIMGTPETRELIENHLDECIAVAKAEGYEYGDDFKEKAIKYLATAGAHKTSMLIDFEEGNPIEIDFLNAKIQEHADKRGVVCKQNRVMLSLVKGLLRHRNSIDKKERG